MVKDTKVEQLENSAVKLTVTVGADAVSAAYDSLLAEYTKNAQLPGFRKGKVPRAVLERKFGESLRGEALGEVLEKSVAEAIEGVDKGPLPGARPRLLDEDLSLEFGEPLTFSVVYDVYPDVELGTYEGLTVKRPRITVADEDEARELERIREQNALVIDKDDGEVADGDIVVVTTEELDGDDAPVPGTRREGYTYTVGEAHNPYHIDREVVGMKKGDVRVVEKEFPEDFEHAELAGSTRRIRLAIERIRQRDVPELDDELAQDVNDEFETLDDLRTDIRRTLEQSAETRARTMVINRLLEQVVGASTIPVPETMVAQELESSWRNLASQYGVDPDQLTQLVAAQGQERDQILEQWRPAATERIKRGLVVQKLIEVLEIQVSDEEIEASVREQAGERNADPEQILEYYRGNRMLPYVKNQLAETRLFDLLIDRNTVKAGEKIAYVDAFRENG